SRNSPEEIIFRLLGFMGKRSKNLLAGDYHDTLEFLSQFVGHDDEFYIISRVQGTLASYEFDKEGYVSKINTTLDWHDYKVYVETKDKELIKSYSHNHSYTITYTK
ncbi:MAG TPA: hypothetical protein K8W04_03010, partial [Bacteroides reticulotermitis]|nr:hypothetical protein [Bacteroides reticulotermitis]